MARRSLRPHLNQIRGWVRQGRTDAWVAHQLEVTVQEIQQFKRQNELVAGDEGSEGAGSAEFQDEIDLRAEDDALIAAELEAAEAERASAQPGFRGGRGGRGGRRVRGARPPAAVAAAADAVGAAAAATGPLEGTFDHGEEGYGLWLDPAVQDNPVYAEHWAGHRPVEVTIEEDQIVIRRAGDGDGNGTERYRASCEVLQLRLAAPAGVVDRLAQVAGEGGVGHHARLPRPRILGRDQRWPAPGTTTSRARRAPTSSSDMKLPAQAPAQLCHQPLGHALEHACGCAGRRRLEARSPSRH